MIGTHISSAAKFFGSIRLNSVSMRAACFGSSAIAWRTGCNQRHDQLRKRRERRRGRVRRDQPQRLVEQTGEISAAGARPQSHLHCRRNNGALDAIPHLSARSQLGKVDILGEAIQIRFKAVKLASFCKLARPGRGAIEPSPTDVVFERCNFCEFYG
ncbi:hypothetical protein [Bradyrhizobium sp. OAE829]|uniref:hypothetical protein n=1 Tax=Bradyrhizobium sp. OAE829 TaxID=2663807 RepID=UPI001788F11D